MNPTVESKKLAIELRENEENYISGHFDLNDVLDKTEQLWNDIRGKTGDANITANEIMPDSDLMKLQTGVAKRSAKSYKPDTLVFNPVEFAMKLKLYYDQSSESQNSSTQDSYEKAYESLWLQLGKVANKLLYTVPSFNFINGTFDADPVTLVKKKRKMKERDKVGKATKPESSSISQNKDNTDMMIVEAERVLGILDRLLKKSEENVVCFYEFVTDPTSYGRTVENIFIVSLLVKEGCVRIVQDRNGLPCLSLVQEDEKKGRSQGGGTQQCILSIGIEEWEDIVKTFSFKKAVIPPRKSAPK